MNRFRNLSQTIYKDKYHIMFCPM